MCRQLAEEPLVDEVVREVGWSAPLRVLAALHYLALSERIDPWSDVRAVLGARRERVARFVAEHAVQTNEVQRSWALLPAFLTLADGRPLDLLELGPSAGLNLLWDRYRYRYLAGPWGDSRAQLELAGDERRAVPSSLLARRVDVRRRRGVDTDPIDVRQEDAALLLLSYVWADQRERLERLRRALELARNDPPELVRGDFVEVLPDLLADRASDALTIVFQTAATGYLTSGQYDELRRILEAAAAGEPFGWISTRRLSERESERDDGYELELALLPEQPRLAAYMGFHGQWLEWIA